MELDVTSAFPTFIGSVRTPDAKAMNHALHDLILAEEAEYPSWGPSDIGGWHSRSDSVQRSDPTVKEVRTRVPSSDIATAQTWVLRFLGKDQIMQSMIHRLSIWCSHAADKSGKC